MLARLTSQFERFVDYLEGQLKWRGDLPVPISFEEFSAAHCGMVETSDIWVGRFLRLSRAVEHLASLAPVREPREAYTRYRQWLPFAYRCERAISAVSRDLDYRLILRDSMLSRA